MSTINLDRNNFEQTIASGVTLVDFWAAWCGPCRMLAPILDEAAEHYGDRAVIAKVNVDENSELSQRFRVMSIPRLILFKDGKQIDVIEGLTSLDKIKAMVDKAL